MVEWLVVPVSAEYVTSFPVGKGMATATEPNVRPDFTEPDYPTSDGRPMGETDVHRRAMADTIDTLTDYFAGQQVYVTGNLLLYYERGNRRKHISPDAMIVRGAEMRPRDYYLLWEEGRSPDAVIEITSKSTRREDMQTKKRLYRDVLQVAEYLLFDPTGDYLNPRLQGFRLIEGEYVPIELVDGRLPSVELGLELEADGKNLRLRNPATGQRLLTRAEARDLAEDAREQAEAARKREEEARKREEEARKRAEAARKQEEAARREAEVKSEAIGRELAELRRKLGEQT